MTPTTPGPPIPPDRAGTLTADGAASQRAQATPLRLSRRLFVSGQALLALAVLSLLHGCGNGLAFTGGSIPPGGTRLVGRVTAAEDPTKTLSHVTIQVVSHPITGGSRTFTTTTAGDGSFAFPSVATGDKTAALTVTATPDSGLDRQSQQVVFHAQNGIANDLVVSLPLSSFAISPSATLMLQPISDIPPDSAVTIHAYLLDDGQRLPIQPTLLYAGNSGSIGVGNVFNANLTGDASITAFWYGLTASQQFTIRTGAAPQPPDPPSLPPVTPPTGPITDPTHISSLQK